MSTMINALRLNGSDSIDPTESDRSITRNLALEEVDLPEPSPGEVLVEPLFAGICGSDNSACMGKPNFSWVERPRTIGHECSARILEVGSGVNSGLKAGDLICAIALLGCGDARCRGCRQGRGNYCRRKSILGFHRDGAFADRMVMEAERCVPLHKGITPLQGSVVEPLSVALQGVHHKSNIKPGMDVVVSGCGIIGLMVAELARAAGARVAITGIERDREVRLKLAKERGFIPIIVSTENPLHVQLKKGIDGLNGTRFGNDDEEGTVDILYECSGAPLSLGTAGLSVQLEGEICVIATYPAPVTFEATSFTRSGQVMSGVMGSDRKDFEMAQTLLSRGIFPVEFYSQQYEFSDAIQAMDDSMSARTPKAIFKINPV